MRLEETHTHTQREREGSNAKVYQGYINDKWSYGDAPNGGIITSLAITAARRITSPNHQDPLSVSTHFVKKAVENAPAFLHVTPLASARSQETVQVALVQEDEARAHFLMTFGNLGRFRLPPRGECVELMEALNENNTSSKGTKSSIAERVELYVPRESAFVRGA